MNLPLIFCLIICALAVADLVLWCIFTPACARGWLRLLPGSGFGYYFRNLIQK